LIHTNCPQLSHRKKNEITPAKGIFLNVHSLVSTAEVLIFEKFVNSQSKMQVRIDVYFSSVSDGKEEPN
jgi:hypothetical protein